MQLILLKDTHPEADPGFPRWWQSQRRGLPIILAILSQKLHEIEQKIGPGGAHILSSTAASTWYPILVNALIPSLVKYDHVRIMFNFKILWVRITLSQVPPT